jgi:hypothetical protein
MKTAIYCKNGYVVVADPATDAKASRVEFLGRELLLTEGAAKTDSGLFLPAADTLATSHNSHEVVVLASRVPDLEPGDRVLVFLGGDDGGVSAAGISAFVRVEGVERGVVHERFVWAKVRDGEILPRGRVVLTERTPETDAAFVRHTFGPGLAGLGVSAPDALLAHGHRATGEETDQVLGSVTALFERVARTGSDVRDDEFVRGDLVCFSPSYMATRLVRNFGAGDQRQYHLVSADEIFFALGE